MIASVLSIFLLIDTIIYLLIAWVYGLVYDAAIIQFIKETDIDTFITRIYTFIGIIVLFFAAYKVIRFIVAPDNFGDKKAGFGSVVTRIFIAILLTVTIPIGFDLGFRAQKAILNDNIIGKIVYGEGVNNSIKNGSNGNLKKTADGVASKADLDKVEKAVGGSGKPKIGTGLNPGQSEGAIFAKMIWSGFIITSDNKKISQNDLQAYIMSDRVSLLDIPGIILPATASIPVIGDLFLFATLKVSYIYLIATIAGGWALYTLCMLFFDIIMRLIKLTVLEILTPFFVAGYILDPSVLSSWWKKVMSTYLLLFIRIFTFQLTMFFISLLFKNFNISAGGTKIGWLSTFILFVTIMFALLYFAKIGPEWIADAFGKKLGESDAKGAGKWFGDVSKQAIGAVVAVGAAVATGGVSLGATGAAVASAAETGGAWSAVKTAAAGAGKTGAGMAGAFKSGRADRDFGKAMDAGAESAVSYKTVPQQVKGVGKSIHHAYDRIADNVPKDASKVAEAAVSATKAGEISSLINKLDQIPDMIKEGMKLDAATLATYNIPADTFQSKGGIAAYFNSPEHETNLAALKQQKETLVEQKFTLENTINKYQENINNISSQVEIARAEGDITRADRLQDHIDQVIAPQLDVARTDLATTSGSMKVVDKGLVLNGEKVKKGE